MGWDFCGGILLSLNWIGFQKVIIFLIYKKVFVNVKDNKVAFFVELLWNLDFVSIENNQGLLENELLNEHKTLLDARLDKYKDSMDDLIDWKELSM